MLINSTWMNTQAHSFGCSKQALVFLKELYGFLVLHSWITMSVNVIFLLHSYPLTVSGQCKFPSHFLSPCAGNFQVFLVDSSLILTDICENAQLTQDIVLTA